MVLNVVSGLISTALIAALSVAWRHRGHLGLLRVVLLAPRGRVRVSFAALLRVKDDDRYVLVVSAARPGFYGPPGGVYRYRPGEAGVDLDRLRFVEHRSDSQREHMAHDLRGFVPTRKVLAFVRWFDGGSGREMATECLRRELVEELGPALDAESVAAVEHLDFTPVRVVVEGPRRAPGESFHQLRRLEVYDLDLRDDAATRFRARLLARSGDPTAPSLLGATSREIIAGWSTHHPINSHTAYLLPLPRRLPDLPPMPVLAL